MAPFIMNPQMLNVRRISFSEHVWGSLSGGRDSVADESFFTKVSLSFSRCDL